jgi:hypothetical protein
LLRGHEYKRKTPPCDVEIAVGAFTHLTSSLPKAPVSIEFFASQCDHLRAALAGGPIRRSFDE